MLGDCPLEKQEFALHWMPFMGSVMSHYETVTVPYSQDG
jgi:hypothetical protein